MSSWLALLDRDDGQRGAPATDARGAPQWLCSWQAADQPHQDALAVDPGLLGHDGPACQISLVLIDSRVRPIADDPAVLACRRDILRDLRFAGCSLLTADPVHVAGTITCARADRPDQVLALRDDPFARLGPVRVLHVGAGLLAPKPVQLGPVIERYAGQPWPQHRWQPEGDRCVHPSCSV